MTVSSFVAPVVPTVSTCRKIAVGVLSLMTVFSSSAALFFTDQFAYTSGVNLGSTTGGGGATWTLASGDVTQIKVTTASGRNLYNHVTTSVGFMSSSDKRVHFGLGPEKSIQSVEIRWPSGVVQKLTGVVVDRILKVEEPGQ